MKKQDVPIGKTVGITLKQWQQHIAGKEAVRRRQNTSNYITTTIIAKHCQQEAVGCQWKIRMYYNKTMIAARC